MRDEKFNFWPLGIASFIFVVVGLIIWTLYFALKNPVQIEDAFLSSYQDVDMRINQIQQQQKEFLTHYKIVWKEGKTLSHQGLVSEHSRGQNAFSVYGGLSFDGFEFEIVPVTGDSKSLEILEVEALLTRPHTKEQDQKLHFSQLESYSYRSEAIQLPAYGRWVIQGFIVYKTADDKEEKKAYFKHEFFAKEISSAE